MVRIFYSVHAYASCYDSPVSSVSMLHSWPIWTCELKVNPNVKQWIQTASNTNINKTDTGDRQTDRQTVGTTMQECPRTV